MTRFENRPTGRQQPPGGEAFRFRGLIALAAFCLCWAAAQGAAQAAPCPNEAIREAQGVAELPECMALEMVSPPKKLLQPAFIPSFSADGSRILFASEAALAGTPGLQSEAGDRYVATLTSSGWQLASTSPPASAEIVFGGVRRGGPQAFSPDLGEWVLLGATQAQNNTGISRLYRGGLEGSFAPASPLLYPIDESGSGALTENIVNYEITASSADLSTSVLRLPLPSISLLPNDPRAKGEGEPGGDRNSYVISDAEGEPTIQLLARSSEGTVYGGLCGAHLGGGEIGFSHINQGAISPDGQTIYLTTRPAQEFDSETGEGPACDTANPLRIMRRRETPTGPKIGEIPPLSPSEPGDDLYQGASADGNRVYFTTPRSLAPSDGDTGAEPCSYHLGASKGCDLYLYDPTRPKAERLLQVSAGGAGDPTPGKGADVLSSVTAISGDGSHAYFVAQGVLTTEPNPEGATPSAGQPNLYVYDADSKATAFIGTLAAGDEKELWGVEGSFERSAYTVPLHHLSEEGAEAGGDGHVLLFASDAPLTAGDADGGHRDVFRYDADAKTLERISKAAPGGSDNGPFDVYVNPSRPQSGLLTGNFGEQTRWVSEDGETAAFITAEPLAPGDGDEAANPYVWHEGSLARIAARAQVIPAEPPAVSADGTEVAFSTATKLLPQDGDTAKDVYVARVDGGFANLVEEAEPCDPLAEGSCRGQAEATPAALANATSGFAGPGNAHPKARCKRGYVRRHGRCVRSHRKHRRHPRAAAQGGTR